MVYSWLRMLDYSDKFYLLIGWKTLEPEVQSDSDIWPAQLFWGGDKGPVFCYTAHVPVIVQFQCLAPKHFISSVFKNQIFFFSLSWVIKWIIRVHDAGRPAERNLQLVTFLKQRAAWAQEEQRELQLDSSMVSSVCCRFKDTSNSKNTQSDTHQDCQKSAYRPQPPSLIWEINKDGDQSCLMDPLKRTHV